MIKPAFIAISCILYLLLTQPLIAAPLVLEKLGSYSLGKTLSYYEDPSSNLRLNQVLSPKIQSQFKKNHTDYLGFGFTDSTYWIKFSVLNEIETSQWFLDIDYGYLDRMNVYIQSGYGAWVKTTAGMELPFQHRDLSYHTFIFPLNLSQHQQTNVLISFKTRSPLLIPIRLNSHQYQVEKNTRITLIHGFFYGILLAMILFNLFIYTSLRDSMYLYYVAYVVFLGLFSFSFEGFSFQYLWPRATTINLLSAPLFANISMIFLILFARKLLDIPHHFKRLDTLLRFWAWGLALFALTLLVITTSFTLMILTILMVVSALMLFSIGLGLLFQGYRPSYYFMLAFTSLLLGVICFASMLLGFLPHNDLTRYALQMGACLEVLLLSFALADRINQFEKERNKAQLEVIQTHREMHNALESKVEQRTEKLEQLNSELKQLTKIDGLTRLYNRTYFDQQLNLQWQHHIVLKQPCALIMLDIDYFKHYNDAYGHAAGDDCIKQISALFTQHVRQQGDWVCRYGGEEFIIILSKTYANQAHLVAQKLQRALHDAHITHKQSPIASQVTISMGVSAIVPRFNDNIDTFLKDVDDALYISKNLGRNRITLHKNAYLGQ